MTGIPKNLSEYLLILLNNNVCIICIVLKGSTGAVPYYNRKKMISVLPENPFLFLPLLFVLCFMFLWLFMYSTLFQLWLFLKCSINEVELSWEMILNWGEKKLWCMDEPFFLLSPNQGEKLTFLKNYLKKVIRKHHICPRQTLNLNRF